VTTVLFREFRRQGKISAVGCQPTISDEVPQSKARLAAPKA